MEDEQINFKCPCCEQTEVVPRWLPDCHGGQCLNCDIYCGKGECKTKPAPPGYCDYCRGRLKPIGRARQNGKNHNDWAGRRLHKKCWKELR